MVYTYLLKGNTFYDGYFTYHNFQAIDKYYNKAVTYKNWIQNTESENSDDYFLYCAKVTRVLSTLGNCKQLGFKWGNIQG